MNYLGAMKLLLLLLSVFSFARVVAQKNDVPVVVNLNDYTVEEKIAVPFKAIKIVDVRFDKSNIGCVNKTASQTSFKHHKTTAVFPQPLEQYLPDFFSNLLAFEPERQDTLLMLVKQFRITDHLFNGINLQYEPELLLKISTSFFKLKNQQLVKLFSIDDILSQKWPIDVKLNNERVADFRSNALLKLLQTIFAKKSWLAKGIGFPSSVIDDGIHKRFQLPLLADTVLRAGVYLNFQEFKQNNPSIRNVLIGMRRDVATEIKDSAGKPLDPKKFWGVCDGVKRYIVFRNELCELIPSDKTFRFLSYTQAKDLSGQAGYGDYATRNGLLGAALIKAMDNPVNREYFYLNMDEEEVHLEELFGKLRLGSLQKEILK